MVTDKPYIDGFFFQFIFYISTGVMLLEARFLDDLT